MQASALSVRPYPDTTPPPLRIVALGDSLVYGFGDPIGGGWVERLRRSWMIPGSEGHALYNLGVRGDGIQQVNNRLEVEFRRRGELKNRLPDLMIVSVGVNDSARLSRPDGRNFTDFDGFELAVNSLLDQAQSLCPLLFIGMVPVDEAKMPFLNCLYYNHVDQARYKEATRLACESRQIPYLDIFADWMKRNPEWRQQQMTEDGLHPNVSGYQALLESVVNWQPFREKVFAASSLNSAIAALSL